MCSESEKLAMLSRMSKESDHETLITYLEIAGERICQRAYPFHPGKTTVPARYASLQVEIAAYLLNKRGAEGQTYHSENGINRTYEAASIPESMLRYVTPFCGVI